VPKPAFRENYPERLVEQVIQGVERGQIPSAQYDAVLIDEGHDFEPHWYQLIVKMVSPETNALLVLYDSAQSIYKKKGGFSFASVGIKARGRTSILRINYRNTSEILRFAYDFAKQFMTSEDEGTPLIEPETAGRHGPVPVLIRFPNIYAELDYIVQNLYDLHANGVAWQHIAILYRTRWTGEEVTKKLRAAKVPVEWLQQSSKSRSFRPDHASVKVLTMHSSKGLEFPVVFIPTAGYLPSKDYDLAVEIKLLYVAMTRAFDRLVITWNRDTPLSAKLQKAVNQQAA
jgi:superfamily I DNA/RNA helicase